MTRLDLSLSVTALAFLWLATLAAAAEWNVAGGDFGTAANWAEGVVPGDAATAANVANGGAATVALPGSYTIGALTVGNHAGAGSILHTGGTLVTRRIILGGDDASGGTGHGTYQLSNGYLRSAADEIWIGSKGGEGTLEVSGNSLVSSSSWVVVGRDGASGHVKLSGTSALELDSNNLPVGCNSPGFTSTFDAADFSRTRVAGEIWVGWLGGNTCQGVMTVKDHARVASGDGFVIGRDGASGTLDVSGDASVDAGGYLICGVDPAGSGTLTLRDNGHVHADKQIWLGLNGASGSIAMSGGCLTGHAYLPDDSSGAGIVFKSGGVLTATGGRVSTPGFSKVAGTALALFNGGAIQATGVTASGGFFVNFADGEIQLGPNGLNFDTKSYAIDINQSLQGTGRLVKQGAGTLTLKGATGHDGDTEVQAGTLALYAPILSDTHVLYLSSGAQVRLNHSQTDRVAKLVVDGTSLPSGRYKAPGVAGSGTELAQLAGTGMLEVVPVSNLYSDWLAAHAPATGFTDDTDHDGLGNGVEHVLGSDPNMPTAAPVWARTGPGVAILTHSLNASLATDVSYYYEWSSDLQEWRRSGETDASGIRVDVTTTSPSPGMAQAQFQVSAGSAPRLFGRITASQTTAP